MIKMKKQNEGKWEQVVYEDLTKFKKEQLVEIIIMCHKANKYYLTKINEAIDYIENYEWEDYPLQIPGHHKLKEEKNGEDLLKILRGEK